MRKLDNFLPTRKERTDRHDATWTDEREKLTNESNEATTMRLASQSPARSIGKLLILVPTRILNLGYAARVNGNHELVGLFSLLVLKTVASETFADNERSCGEAEISLRICTLPFVFNYHLYLTYTRSATKK